MFRMSQVACLPRQLIKSFFSAASSSVCCIGNVETMAQCIGLGGMEAPVAYNSGFSVTLSLFNGKLVR